MRRALGRHPHQAAALQDRLGPGVAESKPVLGHQRLVEVLHSEIPVTRPVLLDDELDLVHRRAPPRYPAAPPPPHNSIVPRDSAPVPRYTSPSVPRVASRSPGLELLQKPDRSSATRTGHIICYRQITARTVGERCLSRYAAREAGHEEHLREGPGETTNGKRARPLSPTR